MMQETHDIQSTQTVHAANDSRDMRAIIAKCPEHLFSMDDAELAPLNDA